MLLFALVADLAIAVRGFGRLAVSTIAPISSQKVSRSPLSGRLPGFLSYDARDSHRLTSFQLHSGDISALLAHDSKGSWEELGGDIEGQKEDQNIESAEDDSLLHELVAWSESVAKTRDLLLKKRNSLLNELKKAESIEATVHRAQLLTSNLYLFKPGMKSAIVTDWDIGENDDTVIQQQQSPREVEIILDSSYSSAAAEADALYQQARKLKRGSAIVKSLLEETVDAISAIAEIELDLKGCCREIVPESATNNLVVDVDMFRLIQDKLIRTSRTTGFSPPQLPGPADNDEIRRAQKNNGKSKASKTQSLGSQTSNVRKLLSPAGNIILVGRNRRGNEYLTFRVAKGEDIWMHARGCPGAHVLIPRRRGSPPLTESCIQMAADLAVFYSDARSERCFDVTSAKPKHLLKPQRAALGEVKLREEDKVYTGRPDQIAQLVLQQQQQQEEQAKEAVHRKKDKKQPSKSKEKGPND